MRETHVPVHSEVLEAIPAYLTGRLEADARRAVDVHAAGCESCAEVLDECRDLLNVMRTGGEALFEPHPGEQSLRAHALGIAAEDDQAIARHVTVCPWCQIEMVAWKRREEAIATGRDAPTGNRVAGVAWGAGSVWRFAAVLIVGVAVGAALDRMLLAPPPPVVQELDDRDRPAAPDADPGGPVPLLILRGTVRGTESIPVVQVDPESRTILIAVPPPLPPNAPGTGLYRFEIAGPETETVWSTELSADGIRRLRGTGEVLVLAVPTAALGDGRREIRMLGPMSAGAEPPLLMRIRFEVGRPLQRQSPAATNAPQ
jgi:hypothetical protein